jgi:spore germination protein KC
MLNLTSCWNYRGLDEFETVVGVAVDKGSTEGTYKLTFENVDLSKAGGIQSEFSPKLIESEGTTIFEAIRKAKIKLANKLYFSHMQIMIVSEELAREKGIAGILSWFNHDLEPREITHVIISGEKTASELFSAKPISSDFVSKEICEIVDEDKEIFSSTKSVPFFKVYNILKSPGIELTLPVFKLVQNGEDKVVKSNGSAVLKDDKMIGFISPEDTQYLLFSSDEITSGVITVDYNNDGQNDISLEVKKSKTKRSYSFDGKRVTVKLDIKITSTLSETQKDFEVLKQENIKKVQDIAEKKFVNEMKNSIKKIIRKYDSDIYGFGNLIYQKDYKLWNKIKDNWSSLYKNTNIEVSSSITIINAGMTK